MRIGIDARFYGSVGKGLGRYTAELIAGLEALDEAHEYVIFLCPENFDEYAPRSPRFRKALVRSRWYGLAEQCFFPFLLYRSRLDLMHFPHFNVPLLYRRPFLFTLHDLILFHYPTARASTRAAGIYRLKFLAYRGVLASALRRARLVVTVSDFTARDIARHYPAAAPKIRVTEEAAPQWCSWSPAEEGRALLAALGLLSGEGGDAIIVPYVLYVGNAYPHKNLGLLLEAAAAFPEKRFVLVGREDYFYQRLRGAAEERGLGNVIFAGYQSDRNLGVLYRFAAIYAFPSLYEGFGLPPLEAMQYGTPVVAATGSSLPEVLGDAACYFDPRNVGDFIRVIGRVGSDAAFRTAQRERGFRQAGLRTWQDMAQLTAVLYREALRLPSNTNLATESQWISRLPKQPDA